MGEYNEKNFFVNREISWLQFNKRVLLEAFDNYNPLFERLKFMSIYFSNLDEFFMIRVGSLKENIKNSFNDSEDKNYYTANKQIKEIYRQVELMNPLIEKIYKFIVTDFKNHLIDIMDFNDILEFNNPIIEQYFENEIFPVLSPQVIAENHIFPFLKNKEIYIIALLKSKYKENQIGIIPASMENDFFTFNIDGRKKIIFISDGIKLYVSKLFPEYNVEEVYKIRVTRNADITIEEAFLNSDDYLDFRGVVQDMLRKRGRLNPVRIQVCGKLSNKLKSFISEKLNCEENIIFEEKMPMDFSFGFNLYNSLKMNDKKLIFAENTSINSLDIKKGKLIKYIEQNDLLVNVPFHNFEIFVDLLYEAADNPNVTSIKISLYRMASSSKVVSALIYAAKKGKEVLCLIELRARFDEEKNIEYSKVLEKAGCKIIYGLKDYKVHSKICLITKKYQGKTSYITQVGTGNYNETTARQYTDILYITADYEAGLDADDLFNGFCAGKTVEKTRRLWIAPNCYKSNLIKLIDDEILWHKLNKNGFIAIKINSMNDIDIMRKLIEASRSGVKIELYIRGICCLKGGIPEYTENIKIKSIVGKYLEHSRIFCFGKNGREKIFIGSGDFLNRNTKRRVEVFIPIKSREAKDTILKILEFCRNDNKKGWIMKPDGNYEKSFTENDNIIDSQYELEKYFLNCSIIAIQFKNEQKEMR